MNGLLEQVPRWFLLALVVVLLPASTTFGTFSFHFAMYYLAEAKAANQKPTQEEIAAVVRRVTKVEGEVAALKMELPEVSKRVANIDANVQKLVARRGR